MGDSDFRPGLDERREVWRLLGHLTPAQRIDFLAGLCRLVSRDGAETRVTDSDGSVGSVYWDLALLAFQMNQDWNAIGERLVSYVRWCQRCPLPDRTSTTTTTSPRPGPAAGTTGGVISSPTW